jgi:hypothetical protein
MITEQYNRGFDMGMKVMKEKILEILENEQLVNMSEIGEALLLEKIKEVN